MTTTDAHHLTAAPDPAALRAADRATELAARAAAVWSDARGTTDEAEALAELREATDDAADAREAALGDLVRAVSLAAEDVTAAAAATVTEEPGRAADDAAWLGDVATLVRVACSATAEDVAALARFSRAVTDDA